MSGLRADPIFFRSLARGKGVRRTAFSIENPDDAPFQAVFVALRRCPDWLHLERVLPSGEVQQVVFDPGAGHVPEAERRRHPAWLVIPARRRVQLVASVNTDHRYFPRAPGELPRGARALHNEGAAVELELSGGARLEVPVAMAEVVLERDEFDGEFAIDFGTTNSCFAYKRRRGGPEGLERPPVCSPEVPSIVYFKDLRHREHPKVLVGHKARLAVLANPSRVYSAVEGIKRLLGSDRVLTVLDARGRSATYRPEEVAAFILRAIIDQAEQEHLDGRRVRRVIATYPTLFSPRHRRALQDALLHALRLGDPNLVPDECLEPGERDPDVQARCDELVTLRLDEANAATFRHVTGPLLEACLRFSREQVADVVSFDFGGGTIDISYLRVDVRRELAERRTLLEARLLGVSGEGAFGGDNVSLELVRLLRAKLAVEAARVLTAQAQAQASSSKAAEGLDIFDRILQSGALPGQPVALEGVERGGEEGLDDEEFAAPPLDRRLAAARVITQHADVILRAAAEGHLEHPLVAEGRDAFVEHVRDLLRAQAHELGRPFVAQDAERIDEALERLMPTRFARYADQDPVMERRAKVLFMDLWREANDRLKPLLVARTGGDTSPAAAEAAAATVQEPLLRLARWVGVDPKVWNDRVSVSLAELEHMIEPRVRRAVHKARDLYLSAVDAEGPDGAPPDDDEEGAPLISTAARRRPRPRRARPRLTVLLTGNASILPLARRALAEAFQGVDHDLVWDERTRKTAVVQGAVEESLLRAEFGGEGGGIHYASLDFLERLPFSIGLYSRFVGFRPIFVRGGREGDVVVVDSRENELVKRDLDELSLYADYHDGAPVKYLGSFDFRRGGRPALDEDLDALPPPEADARGRAVFQALFRLRRDWEVELVNPETGMLYRMTVDPVQVDPREDPFSGEV